MNSRKKNGGKEQVGETKVALVTGGAKRVGRAVALRLAQEGYDLAVTYLTSAADAEELCDEIVALGRRCVAIKCDLTQPESAVKKIHREFQKSYARIDLLLNNASLYEPDNNEIEQARRFWAIHVESPLLLSRAFGPMLSKTGGCIINMVDLLAERPMPNFLAYSASKAGLLNLTRGLARELAPNIRVNGIAPGVVEWERGATAGSKARYLSRVPLKRSGTPQDVADAVIFFCETRYCTGQVLRLDGGRSIS